MYYGAQISEIVPFTYLPKCSNNELRKMYEFFLIKIFTIAHAPFVLGCDKPLLVLKCTDIPD